MMYPDSFSVTLPSDCEIEISRDFDASASLLFDAFTKPSLVRRWLLGPPGWTMPLCEIDLRVGGAYRYMWLSEKDGTSMAIGGNFREIATSEKLVATEKFDEAWYPGEALTTTFFMQHDDRCKVRIIVLYESKEARDTAKFSGM